MPITFQFFHFLVVDRTNPFQKYAHFKLDHFPPKKTTASFSLINKKETIPFQHITTRNPGERFSSLLIMLIDLHPNF